MQLSFIASLLAAAIVYLGVRDVGFQLGELLEDDRGDEVVGSAPVIAGVAAGAVDWTVGFYPAYALVLIPVDVFALDVAMGAVLTAAAVMVVLTGGEAVAYLETEQECWRPRVVEVARWW